MKENRGDLFDWTELYNDENANFIADDVIALAAIHFEDFEKRVEWLVNFVNMHMESPDLYAFEGEAVADWSLEREDLIAILSGIFGHLERRLATPEGRRELEQRYGTKTTREIENLVKNLNSV